MDNVLYRQPYLTLMNTVHAVEMQSVDVNVPSIDNQLDSSMWM